MTRSQKISVSLPSDLLEYAEHYRETHKLSSRSDVLARALKALQEAELAQGYRDLAEEYKLHRDPLVDAFDADCLEPSDETTW